MVLDFVYIFDFESFDIKKTVSFRFNNLFWVDNLNIE